MAATVISLRAELRTDSNTVATPTPRISWVTQASTDNWLQASAELELDGTEVAAIPGRESVLVPWPFAPLSARSIHKLRVRVIDAEGKRSEWSTPLTIVAGFLDEAWSSPMIGLSNPTEAAQPALIRSEFEVTAPVKRATLYATAHGVYQAEINGTEVDDEILKPGWTPYQYRLVHEATDVTPLINPGRNAIGVTLAGGWYTEKYGFAGNATPFYGPDPAVSLLLVIDHVDGGTTTVASDGAWKAASGPITSSGIYQGEAYDARLERLGWSSVGFDDAEWQPVRVDKAQFPTPTARTSPAVRAIEELPVRDVVVSASGAPIFDFGQNLVGRLRVRVSGAAGTTVTLRHAEVLENGELGLRPLRFAKATDTYILKGAGEEVWEPRFTFHGFRYAQIDGLALAPDAVTAVVIHSDMRRSGWFESSHALLNRLHENVVWGMRGNFLYLPTDCPQRDERLGWTGDIQVFAPTASFLYDANGFLSSWLLDLGLEQQAAHGVVPFVVPNVLGQGASPAAAWGDAATVVPSVLYERFGDLGALNRQFDSMKSWADVLLDLADDRMLWEDHFQFGDWLDPDAPPENPFAAKTDADIVATGYLYRSVALVSEAAAILGKSELAKTYADIAATVRAAFGREFVTPAGRLMSDAQTGYAMAIVFGLVDELQRDAMGNRLAELVRANAYQIGTGFVGTPLITDALTQTGHVDAAARLLTETSNPSWLYPVTMGATTIWERWDSMLEDGTINPGEMTSFNHYALGAIADWLHRTVAGLAPAEPGYRVIRIAPQPIPQLEHASATHETPYGLASVGWHREGDEVIVEALVPANATAEVTLPGQTSTRTVGSGQYRWTATSPKPISTAEIINDKTPLSTIIDDVEAFQAINDAMNSVDAAAAKTFRRRTQWTPGREFSEVLWQLPQPLQASVRTALERLAHDRSN